MRAHADPPGQADPSDTLSALRRRLDGVDDALISSLEERLAIVADIAAAKGAGPVIRPAREAAMMARRLAAPSPLPQPTLAHLLRVVIAMACEAQRPFTVHTVAATLDAARFLYGPATMRCHADAASAVGTLANAPGDIACVPAAGVAPPQPPVHAVGWAGLSSGAAVVLFAGAEVERAEGGYAVHAADGALALGAPGTYDGDAPCLGRVDPFPITIPVAT